MKGYDYLINLASLGFINVDLLIKACDLCGLKRVIFISSTSIFTSLNVNSKKVRKQIIVSKQDVSKPNFGRDI